MTFPEEEFKSERILNEIRRREDDKGVVDVEEERVKVVIFTCGGKRYAFYGRDIREILPSCEIAWVPGLPVYLPGLINIRGDIESVIDIRHFLTQEKADPKKCLIAMVVRSDFRSGILIDTVEDVVDVALSAIKPPPSTLSGAAREMVSGGIDQGGEVVMLIELDKLAAQVAL